MSQTELVDDEDDDSGDECDSDSDDTGPVVRPLPPRTTIVPLRKSSSKIQRLRIDYVRKK